VTELDPKNASKHIEMNEKLDTLVTDVKCIKEEFKKIEVVTGQNCLEIQYLKAVK